jgi:hypothetical protein
MINAMTGWGGIAMWAGAVVLGLVIAWGTYRSVQYRHERGLPVGARPESPEEAARSGPRNDRGFGTYMLRLGLPVLAACLLIAIVTWAYVQ